MTEHLNIPYVENATPKQQLNLFLPPLEVSEKSTSQVPLVVYIHGGAWRTGDREEYSELARSICRESVAAGYRLSLPDTPDTHYPMHREDCMQAIVFLQKNAAKWPYDPKRIYLVGHSAGAQLASMLYLVPEQSLCEDKDELEPIILFGAAGVRGIMGVEGIYDIPKLLERWPSYRDFVVQAFGDDPVVWHAGSPVNYGCAITAEVDRRQLPRFLIVHSLEDELVDRGQADAFLTHLQKMGLPVCADFELKGLHFAMLHTDAFARRVVKFVQDTEPQFATHH
jgi:kynurenine formamidase